MTRLHFAALALCTAGFAFDLLEMALGTALGAVFSAPPYSLGASELAWLLSAVYVGAILGAPAFGWLADRYGRRLALVAILGLLAGTSFLAAASRDAQELTAARLLSGLALGAYPPVMFSFLTEILPARRRGVLLLAVGAVGTLGAPAGAFLIRAIGADTPLGLEAWRWVFVIGGAGALVVAVLMTLIPESPRWLLQRGQEAQAHKSLARWAGSTPFSAGGEEATTQVVSATADSQPISARGVLLLIVLSLLSPWATVAFPLLAGAVFMSKGFALSDALLFVAISTFGPALGTLASAPIVNRVDRRVALAAAALCMLVAGYVFVQSDDAVAMVASNTLYMVGTLVYITVMNTYAGELATTAGRASLVSIAWAFNRISSAVAPLVLIPILRASGAVPLYVAIATALGIGLAALWFAPRGSPTRQVA